MMINNIYFKCINGPYTPEGMDSVGRPEDQESETIYIWLVVIHKILKKEQESVLAWKINIRCPLDKFRA